jgi:hypothetical protein
MVSRVLGARAAALLCVLGAHVQGGGLHAQGVAIVPAHLLRSALGYDRVLSDADVELLATTACSRLRPAAYVSHASGTSPGSWCPRCPTGRRLAGGRAV